jgi:hypothetical protein
MLRWLHSIAAVVAVFLVTALIALTVQTNTNALQFQSRSFVEITNPLQNRIDRLPASLVSSWPTYVLDPAATNNNFSKIPDGNEDGTGYVTATSLEELWHPQDLILPDCRLALGFHVRDGVVRHVLPAMDLSYHSRQRRHRNRGLCTVPRAWQWMDIGSARAYSCGLELQTRARQQRGVDEDDEDAWTTLLTTSKSRDFSMEAVLQTVVTALACEPPDALGLGSCMVHVLVDTTTNGNGDNNVVPCPKPGNEIRVRMKDDLDGESVFGELHVRIEKTGAGSESQYLPAAYKALFFDPSLRRPAYTETKRRVRTTTQSDE